MPRKLPTNVTTTSSIEEWTIEAYLGPVAVHRVAGTGFFSDMFADFSDVFGGRSGAYRQQLESLYAESIGELTEQTALRGGNWVVGFHADFDEISGKNKQMFMLVAMGTAVRARRSRPQAIQVSQEDRMAVTGIALSALIREQRILSILAAGQALSADGLDFLAERRNPGAIPSALALAYSTTPNDSAEQVARQQATARYLRALPGDVVSEALYGILEQDPALSQPALTLLRELRLADLGRVVSLLQSPNAHTRWVGVQSLNASAPAYRMEDIARLEQLRSSLAGVLLPRPLIARKKLFGEKQEWECICGAWAGANERCSKCSRNQLGIGPTDLTPDAAAEFLASQVEALTVAYGRPAHS